MAFRVFISHSTADLGMVYQLKYWLEANDVEAYVAQLYLQPGIPLAAKVRSAIAASDCVVALLTKDGSRSAWVHDEVGIAEGLTIPILPVLERGTALNGLLQGRECIEFDGSAPLDAVRNVVHVAHGLKLTKANQERTAALALMVLGLLALAAVSSTPQEQPSWR